MKAFVTAALVLLSFGGALAWWLIVKVEPHWIMACASCEGDELALLQNADGSHILVDEEGQPITDAEIASSYEARFKSPWEWVILGIGAFLFVFTFGFALARCR